ncbi:MAG: helix-hairpin-helix domain-containing protein [Ktedonobacteraceae bacterium]
MDEPNKQVALKELQGIPGVGKSISMDLWNMGFREVQELQNQDPEEMYLKFCVQQGMHVDRCLLYVFRCAVYYASNEQHDPELLKWWNWKDR